MDVVEELNHESIKKKEKKMMPFDAHQGNK